MNDTTVTTDSDTSDNVKSVIVDLKNNVAALLNAVVKLERLQNSDKFKYLSKEARNKLLDELMNSASSSEEVAKATLKAMKKVKRENLPDEVADSLIFGDSTAPETSEINLSNDIYLYSGNVPSTTLGLRLE